MSTTTIDEVCAYLNRVLSADPVAVSSLLLHRVPCSRALLEDPSCQVDGETIETSALGILNGLFGIDEDGWGYLSAVIDKDRKLITRFQRTPPQIGRFDGK